jgi:hypothetical protein
MMAALLSVVRLRRINPRSMLRCLDCVFLIFSFVMFFSRLSSVDSRRLQFAFNSCTRYVFNLRRFDHRSTHRDELLGMPLFTFFFQIDPDKVPDSSFC